jgi:hypothetical protein
MKRFFTTVLAASMMLAGTTMFAQKVNVEAGFGLSSTRFDYALDSKTADLFGGTVGVSYAVPLIEQTLDFAPGIQFGYFTKGDVSVNLNMIDLHLNGSFTETYIAVPLDLNLKVNISDDMKLMLIAGPTIDVGLSSRLKESTTKLEKDIYDVELGGFAKYNRFDVLIGGGVGFDVMDAIRFSVRYDYGLVNRNSGSTGNLVEVHRSQLKFGVGFLF